MRPSVRPDHLLLDALASHGIDKKACGQTTRIEADAEPVGEACQVVLGLIAVIKLVECSSQSVSEIGTHAALARLKQAVSH